MDIKLGQLYYNQRLDAYQFIAEVNADSVYTVAQDSLLFPMLGSGLFRTTYLNDLELVDEI